METLVWIVNVVSALSLIGLVLLQHGKGADMGAAFGSGASGSLFGATGSANFLSRATAVVATVFFVTSLTLAYFSANRTKPAGVMDAQKTLVQPAIPVDNAQPANPAPAPAGGSRSSEIPR